MLKRFNFSLQVTEVPKDVDFTGPDLNGEDILTRDGGIQLAFLDDDNVSEGGGEGRD